MLTAIAGAIFWGGWNAAEVRVSVTSVNEDVKDMKQSLKEFPTRYELQTLVKSSINDETKDLREKFGNLDARIQAIEHAKEKP